MVSYRICPFSVLPRTMPCLGSTGFPVAASQGHSQSVPLQRQHNLHAPWRVQQVQSISIILVPQLPDACEATPKSHRSPEGSGQALGLMAAPGMRSVRSEIRWVRKFLEWENSGKMHDETLPQPINPINRSPRHCQRIWWRPNEGWLCCRRRSEAKACLKESETQGWKNETQFQE